MSPPFRPLPPQPAVVKLPSGFVTLPCQQFVWLASVRSVPVPSIGAATRGGVIRRLTGQWTASVGDSRLRAFVGSQLALMVASLGPWQCGEISGAAWHALHESQIPWMLAEPTEDLRIVDANTAMAHWLGVATVRRLLRTSYHDWLAQDTRRFLRKSGAYLTTGRTHLMHFRDLRATDGHTWPALGMSTPILDSPAIRRYLFGITIPAPMLAGLVMDAAEARKGHPVAVRHARMDPEPGA